jgi:hypothetical protein
MYSNSCAIKILFLNEGIKQGSRSRRRIAFVMDVGTFNYKILQ